MIPSTTFLLALKGTCALNCLAALHLAGPLPVTQRTIIDLTGFDNEAVSKGLATLRVLGLVTCEGDERRTAWQLTDGAERLPLPLDSILPSPENPDSAALFKEEEEEKEIDSYELLDSSLILNAPSPEKPDMIGPAELPPQMPPSLQSPPALQSPQMPPALQTPPAQQAPQMPQMPQMPPLPLAPPAQQAPRIQQMPPLPLAPPTPSAPPQTPPSPSARWPSERALRRRFYAVFEAAGIFLQFRRPLADALLSEPNAPAGLRQALGWLCYAERRLPHVNRGAVVYISLRDQLPCDPAYLPPLDLRFEAALAWAMRGGEAEPPPPMPYDDVASSQTPGDPENPGVLDDSGSSPERDLWQALIARLARELSPVVIDSQLRPARLLSLGAEHCQIGAATPQSRDWLRTRLAPVLARALSELAGRPLAVEIMVDT